MPSARERGGSSGAMLQKLDAHIRECHEHAVQRSERAKNERDSWLRSELLRMEEKWLHLAESYQFAQSLEAFVRDGDRRDTEEVSPAAE
jgi:hypothetical protein